MILCPAEEPHFEAILARRFDHARIVHVVKIGELIASVTLPWFGDRKARAGQVQEGVN